MGDCPVILHLLVEPSLQDCLFRQVSYNGIPIGQKCLEVVALHPNIEQVTQGARGAMFYLSSSDRATLHEFLFLECVNLACKFTYGPYLPIAAGRMLAVLLPPNICSSFHRLPPPDFGILRSGIPGHPRFPWSCDEDPPLQGCHPINIERPVPIIPRARCPKNISGKHGLETSLMEYRTNPRSSKTWHPLEHLDHYH